MKKHFLPESGTFYKANLHAHTSVSDGKLTPAELKEAYKIASYQADEFIPVDWMETTTPEVYLLNGEKITLNWYKKSGNEIFSEWL